MLGVFLSVAGTSEFGFPSALQAFLVIFDSQGDGFPMYQIREVWVTCVSPQLCSGTGRGFDLGLLHVWTVGLENWLLHPVLQLLYSTTSEKTFPL